MFWYWLFYKKCETKLHSIENSKKKETTLAVSLDVEKANWQSLVDGPTVQADQIWILFNTCQVPSFLHHEA